MPPLVIAAIALAAAGTAVAVRGAAQKSKAKKIASANKRPVFEIPKPYSDNLSLTSSMAGQGISDSARQYLTSNADRGLTTSVDAILKAGGDPNLISGIYDDYQQGISRISLAEDQERLKHISMYLQANENMGALEEKKWGINKFAPYADKAAAAAKLAATGEANINKGIDMGVSGISMWANAKSGAKAPGGGGGGSAVAGGGGPVTSGTNLALSSTPSASSFGGPTNMAPMPSYYGTAPTNVGAYGTPTNMTMPSYYGGTQFLSSSGYVPSVTGRSSANMQGLGMNSLQQWGGNQGGENKGNQYWNQGNGINYDQLLLTQWSN